MLWSTQEFGLAALPESWTSGSSIMPQKRNPDGAELVRAKAAGFLARLQGLGAVLKGLPLAYNSDLQEDKLYVFATREELDLCLEAMTAMVEGLSFDAAQGARRGRRRLRSGHRRGRLPGAARVCPSERRIGSRGGWWLLAAGEGRPLAGVTLEELRELSPLFDDDYYAVVDLDRVVAAKISPGGTAPERVAEQLALLRMARPTVR